MSVKNEIWQVNFFQRSGYKESGMQVNKILVPVDGSEYSRKAVQYAIDLAKFCEAGIVLVHCRKKLSLFLGEPYFQQALTKLMRQAEEILAPFKELIQENGLEIEERILEGNPGEVIAEAARIEKCELIVMGSRGLSDLEGLILGSVAHRVLQSAHCPVLIVR